ncbi:hypothetical protein ABTM32_22170, partial [Acinetobacter baumannii]
AVKHSAGRPERKIALHRDERRADRRMLGDAGGKLPRLMAAQAWILQVFGIKHFSDLGGEIGIVEIKASIGHDAADGPIKEPGIEIGQ